MHGFILVVWEKYLFEQYGESTLAAYRNAIANTPASIPLASRVYDDAFLLKNLDIVIQATGKTTNTLLRDFGRYLMTSSQTARFCSYIYSRAHNARDLLLLMYSSHGPLHQEGTSKCTFETLSNNPNELLLSYTSRWRLCTLLQGVIEGTAQHFGERVSMIERACMHEGARACILELRFSGSPYIRYESKELIQRLQAQKRIANTILQVLPTENGITLQELQERLQQLALPRQQTRPSVLLCIINHLYFAGIISSTANQPGDNLAHRRYWRQRS